MVAASVIVKKIAVKEKALGCFLTLKHGWELL
jgi:hypothetical protein